MVSRAPEQATDLLGTDLKVWVAERRETGRSWDSIAKELFVATDRAVDVTGEWLRRLYGQVAA